VAEHRLQLPLTDEIIEELRADDYVYLNGPAITARDTTAARMDAYTIPLLEAGLKGAIGKGGRGHDVREAFVKHRAVYFLAVGGAAALLSKRIVRSNVVAYEDLGMEAIRLLEFEEFPAVVCNDIHGGDALETGKAEWRREVTRGA